MRSAAALVMLAAGPALACPWQVDMAVSKLGFTATMQGAAFEGRFKAFTATIDFDPAHPETGRAQVVVPLGSVDTAFEERDDELKKAEWFDVKTYPDAVFETTSFSKSQTGFLAKGMLTLRGVRVAVDLPFTLENAQAATRVRGRAELRRLAFGLGWPTTDMVGDGVTVSIDLLARPAAGCAFDAGR
jgi:polyisoprenoid-binding protein YceI